MVSNGDNANTEKKLFSKTKWENTASFKGKILGLGI
jgi:hypothetical protein